MRYDRRTLVLPWLKRNDNAADLIHGLTRSRPLVVEVVVPALSINERIGNDLDNLCRHGPVCCLGPSGSAVLVEDRALLCQLTTTSIRHTYGGRCD